MVFYFTQEVNDYILDDKIDIDAIVVFSGEKQQLYVSAQLLKHGYNELIFIIGNGKQQEYKDIMKCSRNNYRTIYT